VRHEGGIEVEWQQAVETDVFQKTLSKMSLRSSQIPSVLSVIVGDLPNLNLSEKSYHLLNCVFRAFWTK
jgi:hypothetical protein